MLLKNKYSLWLFLLCGTLLMVLSQLPMREVSPEKNNPQPTIAAAPPCTILSNSSSNVFSEGELPPAASSSSIVMHVKKMIDQAKAKSHIKYLNVKTVQLDRAESNFFAKRHCLQYLHVSHSPTQSQLQVFII